MASLSEFRNTCSMAELAIFFGERPSISQIKSWCRNGKRGGWYSAGVEASRRRAIICNTIHHTTKLKKAGFKEIAQYNGNDGGVVHVMLWIHPENRIKKAKK